MRTRPRALVLVLVAAAALLAGCAPAPAFPVVEEGSVALEGSHVLGRRVEVPVTALDRAVRIEGVSLFSPYFEILDAVRVDQPVEPGGTATVSVPVGAAQCPSRTGATTLQVVLEVDGAEVLQSVALEDGSLAARHAQECVEVAIADEVTRGFGAIAATEGTAVRTSIILVRVAGSDEVVLEDVIGSTYFSIAADDGALPGALAPAAQQLEVPVTIEADGCAGVPFGGASSAFGFAVVLRTGDGGEARLSLRPEGELLAQLEDIATTCDAE